MPYADHKKELPVVSFSIIVVSDSRNEKNDESGKIAKELIEERYKVDNLEFIKNNSKEIVAALKNSNADVIITIGGTGISERDITVETIRKISKKELGGFGEVFRMLSFERIGTGAIMSRAFCGLFDSKVIFSLPGSPDAVRLAIRDIILKEASHIVKHVKKSSG